MRVTAVCVALALLAVACSGGDGGDDATPATDPTQADAGLSSVAGSGQTDASGNTITIHGWSPWPDTFALFDPYDGGARQEALFGALAAAAEPGAGLLAVDLEVCATGDRPPASWGLVTADGEQTSAAVDLRVVSPRFSWPAAGSCARGWQGLSVAGGATPTAVRYLPEAGPGLDWQLAAPVAVPLATGESVPAAGAPAELSDELAGWTVSVGGWAEVGDTSSVATPSGGGYVQPVDGSRLVAALVELCRSPEAGDPAPALGMQVDGWNLMGEFGRGEPWAPGFDPLGEPQVDGCASGWVPFELPLGAAPSGVFVSGGDPDTSWSEWRLDPGSPLAAPGGGGLPDSAAVQGAVAACGVSEPLQVTRGGQPQDGTIASAAAIPTGPGRVDIYLSASQLREADIPRPVDPGVFLVSLGLEQTDGSSLSPGLFTDQVTGTQYGTVSVVPGGEGSGIAILIGASVELTEVTDTHVCGFVSASGGPDSVIGPFAAPIWQPET